MLNEADHRFRDTIASALGWWSEAGLDTLVADEPRDWLAAPTRALIPASPASGNSPLPMPSVPAAALPDGIEALHTLLANGDYAPNPAPVSRRVAPSGNPAAALMVIADQPDTDDSGQLFTGESGRLFDAMLAAMKLDRERIYCAPLSPARSAGRIDEQQGQALAELMRRHISLAAPRALILFGDEAARWLLGPDAMETRGGIRPVKHDGGMVPAIAISHPRTLRRIPVGKAAAWADMRLLMGVLGQ